MIFASPRLARFAASGRWLMVGLALVLAAPALAQEARIGFSALRQNPEAPVEVTSDQLSIDQATGLAVFEGSVVATQDTLRLTADRVEVEYDSGPEGGVRRLIATGNVLVDTGMETAAGDVAIYEIATAALEMTGNVRLTQGTTRFEGPSLRADLEAGTGIMEGRVRTTFVPAGEGAGP